MDFQIWQTVYVIWWDNKVYHWEIECNDKWRWQEERWKWFLKDCMRWFYLRDLYKTEEEAEKVLNEIRETTKRN